MEGGRCLGYTPTGKCRSILLSTVAAGCICGGNKHSITHLKLYNIIYTIAALSQVTNVNAWIIKYYKQATNSLRN